MVPTNRVLQRFHPIKINVGSEKSPLLGTRRGGRAINKRPRSSRGRGGSSNHRTDLRGTLNQPPRLRKEASRHFIYGRSHPSFAKEGTCARSKTTPHPLTSL